MNQKSEKLLPYRTACIFACLLVLYAVIEGLDTHLSTRTATQRLPVSAMFGNALPGWLVLLALTGLTRRVFFSFAVTAALCIIFYTVSHLKQAHLGSPLIPDDFYMAGQLGAGGWDIFSKYIPSKYKYGAVIFCCLILLGLLCWKERPCVARNRWWLSITIGLIIAISCIALFDGKGPWTYIYKTKGMVAREVLYLPPLNITQNGLINSQVQLQIAAKHAPVVLDRKAGQAFMDKIGPKPLKLQSGTNLPDIVIVQSEAFFDSSILKSSDGQSTTVEYSKLAQSSLYGPLHVPTIGGATIRTEFEILTGIPLRYFNSIEYPYLQLDVHHTPNLVKTLKTDGYTATAIHGNSGAFWNRDEIFRQMGFEKFITLQDFSNKETDGSYTSDRAMTDEIISRMNQGHSPQFIFAISIEAHGPYSAGYAADKKLRDDMPVPANLTAQQELEFRTYMYHARHADEGLGQLAAWLRQRKRPFLLLFYGDHLPALHPIYQMTGFKDGQSEYVQPVPWILVGSNISSSKRMELAAWMLPDLLLQEAGLPEDSYFALTRAMRPVLNTLTSAPNIRLEPQTAVQKQDDAGMGDVAKLRLRDKL